MKTPRILFVDLGSHDGGVERYIEGLAEILSPVAQLYAVCSLPKLATDLKALGVETICVGFLRSKWLKPLRVIIALFIIVYCALRYKVRTFQINGFFESYLLLPLWLLRCTTIYTMHGPFETELYCWYRNPERFFPRYLSKLCLCFASCVVCVSETVGDTARSALSARKIHVIPNWVAVPDGVKEQFSLGHPIQLLFVGRVEKYKGIHLVVEAMKSMPDVSLLVVGEGSYRSQLEKEAEGLKVEFLGFQPAPGRFYESSDIFVNPSLGPEGLPLVSLEAMAYGLPCIFSDLPVHQEITLDGTAAALFSRGSADSLRQALERMVHSGADRTAFGISARETVLQKYSRKAAEDRYRNLFAC